MKHSRFVLSIVLPSCLLLSVCVQAQSPIDVSETPESIAGVPAQIVRNDRASFKTRFIEIVIPDTTYSKDNLIKIWRYFCDEKYLDKKDRFDLRVFIQTTYEYNKQFAGLPVNMHTGEAIFPDGVRVKVRSFEAQFERKGDGALAYGGDNEILYYCPDSTKPDEKVVIVLAGKNR
jgi:hypothetical protein